MWPADVWLTIEGYNERWYEEFKMMRLIAFETMKSYADPKKSPPSTPEKYMPHSMDRKEPRKSAKEIREAHEKKKAERERLLNGKNIHSTN